MTPSQAVRKPKKNPKRAKREHYDVGSYRRAIQRACDIADRLSHEQQPEVVAEQRIIPRWHPHQLRHNAATKLRKEFGIEVARIICGHHSSAVTEIYAEQDLSAAADIMTRVG